MTKKQKWFVFAAIFVAFIFAMYFLYYDKNSIPGQYDDFAKCLTQNGVKMYGAYWCPHCNEQKEMFGNSWDYIEYVECSLPNAAGQTTICNQAGISGYPTWELGNSTRLQGTQTFEMLSKLTGCSIAS
ncbi:hypothetical protein HY448_00190 [Candidatus Pacearchaeota archaeon]|nr:hypothetical protein [Candidatus Pacearchaeota archaeon]